AAVARVGPGRGGGGWGWGEEGAGRKLPLRSAGAAGHERLGPRRPAAAGSLVLVTSRRRLTALEDSAVISLDTLPAEEAAVLLTRLAGRAGISATDPPVGEITPRGGDLPPASGLSARRLQQHPARAPGPQARPLYAP